MAKFVFVISNLRKLLFSVNAPKIYFYNDKSVKDYTTLNFKYNRASAIYIELNQFKLNLKHFWIH